jgi:hypothetical protein
MMKIQSALVISILTLGSDLGGASPESGNPRDSKAAKDGVIAAPKGVNIKDLFQHWVHSREEQRDPDTKKQIFRPATSRQFPPSRFRMAYKFSPNGKCEWMFLDPADAHHFKPGKWEIDVTDGTLLKITADGKMDSFRILELSKDLLRLAPVKPAP